MEFPEYLLNVKSPYFKKKKTLDRGSSTPLAPKFLNIDSTVDYQTFRS